MGEVCDLHVRQQCSMKAGVHAYTTTIIGLIYSWKCKQ